jgi:CNT family concentrative nucleoside transporter
VSRLIGLVGLVVLFGIAYLASNNRKAIRWKTVGWGLALQLLFAVLVLKLGIGQEALSFAATAVKSLISYADMGSDFIFGWLVQDPDPNRFVFAFKVLPIVIFISSFFTCLYYLGVMQLIVLAMAKVEKTVYGC